MKTKDPLDRLLKSAASAPAPAIGSAAFGLEARVMGAWRTNMETGVTETFFVWVQRAAICACLLALMSLAWNYSDLAGNHGGGEELTVADAAMSLGVEP